MNNSFTFCFVSFSSLSSANAPYTIADLQNGIEKLVEKMKTEDKTPEKKEEMLQNLLECVNDKSQVNFTWRVSERKREGKEEIEM